jgi:hypothetical protein
LKFAFWTEIEEQAVVDFFEVKAVFDLLENRKTSRASDPTDATGMVL